MMSYHLLPGKLSNALVTSGKLINSTSFFDGRRGFLVCRTNSLGLSPEGSLNLLRVPALILIAIPKWCQFFMLRLSSSFMHTLHKGSECFS